MSYDIDVDFDHNEVVAKKSNSKISDLILKLTKQENEFFQNNAIEVVFNNGTFSWNSKRKKKAFDINESFFEYSKKCSPATIKSVTDYEEVLKHEISTCVSDDVEYTIKKFSEFDYELLEYFRWSINSEGVLVMFVRTHYGSYKRIIDIETGAKSTNTSNGERIITEIKRKIEEAVNNDVFVSGVTYKKGSVHIDYSNYFIEINRMFMLDECFEMPMPVVISNSPNVPCMFYFDLNKLKHSPCPEWDKWINNRMDIHYHDVFKAWIFSVFVEKNNSRQILWLHDAGGTGKTAAYKAISSFMDKVGFTSINDKTFGNQFGMSSIFGARLVVNGDCKDPNFCSSFEAHQISGGDLVRIEFKGATPFMYESRAKILICSNMQPKINISAFNESSRLIFIPLKDNTQISKEYRDEFIEENANSENQKFQFKRGNLADKLTAEMNGFLFSCKDSYEKLCPYNSNIIIPEQALEEMFGQCASNEVIYFEEIAENYLDFSNKTLFTTAQDLLAFMKSEQDRKAILTDSKRYGNFLRYLKETYNVISMKKTIDVNGVIKRKNVYQGMKIKGNSYKAEVNEDGAEIKKENSWPKSLLTELDRDFFDNDRIYDDFIFNHLIYNDDSTSENIIYERFINFIEAQHWNDFKNYILQSYEIICDGNFSCGLR